MSKRQGTTWTTAQYNFTVGVRGSAIEAAWEDRLTRLRVNNAKTHEVIRRQAIRKTLELSDVVLRHFHVATQRAPNGLYRLCLTTSPNSTGNFWAQ